MMAWARAGPTPGSWSSCSSVAVLMSISGVFAVALGAGVVKIGHGLMSLVHQCLGRDRGGEIAAEQDLLVGLERHGDDLGIRLRVEAVDMARPAVHEQVDHALGFRRKMLRLWRKRIIDGSRCSVSCVGLPQTGDMHISCACALGLM